MFCPMCGKEVIDGGCSACGYTLTNENNVIDNNEVVNEVIPSNDDIANSLEQPINIDNIPNEEIDTIDVEYMSDISVDDGSKKANKKVLVVIFGFVISAILIIVPLVLYLLDNFNIINIK